MNYRLECHCSETGSVNSSCNAVSGQCFCKPGVGSRTCDSCMRLHRNLSSAGCEGKQRFVQCIHAKC